MRAILLDIEGTTTPISFVYDVLFPFAAGLLEATCEAGQDDPHLADAIALLRSEYHAESSAGDAELPPFGDGSPYARYLMSQDRKSTGLKRLQGLIWKRGYESGELEGAVFPDVADSLSAWRARGVRLGIFSSGSVLAQKLLFSTTPEGDLTRFFERYHDTGTGSKKEADSYRAIAASFDLKPAEILFLSDIVAELDAAREAGMATGLLERPGNHPVESTDHRRYRDFREIEV